MSVQLPQIDVSAIPPTALLLDVREPVEWSAGHIEGARHIPMNEVPRRIGELPADREIVVVCKVGGRSAQVTAYLNQQGRRAINLEGGMVAWRHAGRPMVSEDGGAPRVH